jgi:hypothetical protein
MGVVYLAEDLTLGRKVALHGKHFAVPRGSTSQDIILFRGLRPKS